MEHGERKKPLRSKQNLNKKQRRRAKQPRLLLKLRKQSQSQLPRTAARPPPALMLR